MVAAYVADLERLISKPRLDRYRPANNDDLETAVAYLWNVALSEALHQGISAVEIALRNSIHNTFTANFGTDQWFWAVLQNDDLKHVNGIWTKLAARLKQPPSSGKVIAELTMGFWPRLFAKSYDKMWTDNRSALLWAVYPHHPRRGVPPADWLTRDKAFDRTQLVVDLGNRVMHHEPIFRGLARPNQAQPGQPTPVMSLPDIHQHMLAMLDWIDPQLRLTLSFVDRFPTVYGNEESTIRRKLEAHFNARP